MLFNFFLISRKYSLKNDKYGKMKDIFLLIALTPHTEKKKKVELLAFKQRLNLIQ